MKNLPQVTVVHVVGANSWRGICLDELAQHSRGKVLDFDYHIFLQENVKPETAMRKWLLENVTGEDLLLCTGLPPRVMMKWLKICLPGRTFKQEIWEVHHDPRSEEIIMKERSLRLIFEGLFLDAERLLKFKSNELITHTPLKEAILHLGGEATEMSVCLKRLLKWQMSGNKVSYKKAHKCMEAMDSVKRSASLTKLLKNISDQIVTKELVIPIGNHQ